MAADKANPIFPLAETNVVNTGVPVYKKLPEGVSAIRDSIPRQAQGSGGRRFSLCARCGGWVAGTPVLQTKATPFVAGAQASNIYRCRRCGFPLDTGPASGTEQKNSSGVGTEGTMRP